MKILLLLIFLLSNTAQDKIKSRVIENNLFLLQKIEKIVFVEKEKEKIVKNITKQNLRYSKKEIKEVIDIKENMKNKIDLDYKDISFEEVLDDIRLYPEMNRIIVMWADIRNNVGIEPEDTITLKISDVSIEKALDLILEQVSSDKIGEIGYFIDDENIIKIKTVKDHYHYFTEVYYISDLIENFNQGRNGMSNMGSRNGRENSGINNNYQNGNSQNNNYRNYRRN